jgi:hypothetical protein
LNNVVAIAYLMQKYPYVFPIVGGRKVEHLQANLEALEISLGPEQITYLESIVPFDKGFPYTAFVSLTDYFFNVCKVGLYMLVARVTDLSTTSWPRLLDTLTDGLVLGRFTRLLGSSSFQNLFHCKNVENVVCIMSKTR